MKKLLLWGAIALSSLLIIVAFLPTLLSTSWAKPLLFSTINKSLVGTVHADEVQAGWFSGLELTGVTLKDTHEHNIATFSTISYKSPLYALLASPIPSGTVTVVAPSIVVADEKGQIPINELLARPQTDHTLPPLTIHDLSLSLDIQKGTLLDLSLLCHVVDRNTGRGTIDLKAHATNFLELQKVLEATLQSQKISTNAEADVALHIKALPTSLLDAAMQLAGKTASSLPSAALGPTIDLDQTIKIKNDQILISTQGKSATLQAAIDMRCADGLLQMPQEALISYIVTPELVQSLTLPQNLSLDKPVPFRLALQPIMNASVKTLKETALSCSLIQDEPLLLKADNWSGPVALKLDARVGAASLVEKLSVQANAAATFQKETINTALTADISELATVTLHTTTQGNFAAFGALIGKEPSDLAKLIGTKVSATIDATYRDKKVDGTWSLQSDTIQNAGNFAVKNGAMQLHLAQKPYTLNNILLDETILDCVQEKGQDLMLTLTSGFDIKAPYAVKSSLQAEFKIPQTGNIVGRISCPDLYLQKLGAFQLALPLEIERETKKVKGSLDLTSKEGDKEAAKANATFTLQSVDAGPYDRLPPILAASSGTFSNFPVTAFSKELSELIGNNLSGKWNVGFDNSLSKQEPLELSLTGQNASVEVALQLGKEIKGKNGLSVSWQMTPERFAASQKLYQNHQDLKERKKELSLLKPIDVQFTCSNLALPLATFLEKQDTPNLGTNLGTLFGTLLGTLLDALTLDGSLNLSALDANVIETKENGTKTAISIAPLTGALQLHGKERSLAFSLKTNKSYESQKGASIFIQGEASHLWNEQGLDPEHATVKLDVKIQELPLDILQGVHQSAGDKAVAVLGKTISADLKGHIAHLKEGKFEGTVTSPRLQSNIACVLKGGSMHLERPLVAQYELTPEAGEALLKDINPLLMTAARSQRPITLTIDSEDFLLPLRPFSTKEMKIKKIKIDPGIITATNGGMLSLLVGLLNMKTKPGEELDLWFTPIYVEVKKGIVTCKRSDALLGDAFPIATWGSIDLEKNSVEMTLGISGQALSRSFGITTADPDYLLQIPIRGSTQSPKFDTVRATAKITALKMQQNKSRTSALLGGLLEAAASTKDETPPAPTTQPFPWHNKS